MATKLSYKGHNNATEMYVEKAIFAGCAADDIF